VLFPQMVCASALLAIGLAAIVYGLRVLSGKAGMPWSMFVRKSPIDPPPPQPREVFLAATLGLMVGLISLLGGLGMLLLALV
jgi:hypothetical protein